MEPLLNRLKNLRLDQSTVKREPNVFSRNNYRSHSIYPSITELIHSNHMQLPHNITKGSYDDMAHYLSTHFYLLREDFLKPIRENLLEFLNDPSQKLLNIKIHEVEFIRKGVKKSDICHCLEIKKGITYHSWNIKRDPKRFMIGSLLIFSKDNFKTIFCGRVADNRSLLYRKVLVGFESPIDLKYAKTYLMIECNAFFEPYYQVLKVIQGISSEKNLSMKQYLIDVNPLVARPKYLKDIKYKISDPDLNRSQLAAINGALSQELVIIQGPPGTGKTFLGLKIAKLLLSISSKWYDNTPMLVISFTNHALDQFLEGLTGSTQSILRLGGQSKNPKMKNYTIRERRFEFYNSSPSGRECQARISPLYREYNSIERKIISLGNQMDNIATTKPTCIFYFHVLAEGVPEMNMWSQIKSPDQMVRWLLEEDGSMGEVRSYPDDSKTMSSCYTSYLKESHKGSKYCMLSVSIMENAITKLHDKITEISKGIEKKLQKTTGFKNINLSLIDKKQEERNLSTIHKYLLRKLDYLKLCLKKDFGNRLDNQNLCRSNPFKMPVRVRWQLYQYWLAKYETYMKEKLDNMIPLFKPIYDEFSQADTETSLAMMRYQKIIGMTTTMAARMHSTIKALKCPIVIVEEAAEVLEAHIIPVLTEHCEHLILIGDHKQLKPSTADYEIEKRYKLGVSLFERMVNNNIQCHTLNVQHRMRPEVSSLITPSIYPVLHDHESVKSFDQIRGMERCVYFISHEESEEGAGNTSKKNLHEAKFLIQLAAYLLKNDYKPEEITILAAYLGQVGALIQEQKDHPYDQVKNVKITSVDNFQGEENKIILLSLVRNNNNNKIGFLSIENRVCVALSRAKEGMYVMGNMAQLTANSGLWRKINKSLLTQKAIGHTLPLKCREHGEITRVQCAKDFDTLAPNGGCSRLCGIMLKCGHRCKSKCHEHQNYNCMEPCRKSACKDATHICPKRCYQPCGMCVYKLRQKLACGHHVRCFMTELEDYRCVQAVYVRLRCGHKEEIACNEVDSDFEEDLDCSACKSISDQKEASLDKNANEQSEDISDEDSEFVSDDESESDEYYY